jgi:dUTP pyrophosphatase
MERVKVFVAAADGVSLPEYATGASSGMDLRAFVKEPILIKPLGRALIPTGISIAIPEGYEAQVRPRSGLAINHGVTVLNTPGTIDADYRGEVKVILANFGDATFEVKNGDRIAQIVFHSTIHAAWERVKVLQDTERGAGGFGSTGRK